MVLKKRLAVLVTTDFLRDLPLKCKTMSYGDMVKHELQVTSCELRVTSYELNT